MKDIWPYYQKLAREHDTFVFATYEIEKIPALAQNSSIYPTFKFFVNGDIVQQCYGGHEVSLQTNFTVQIPLTIISLIVSELMFSTRKS